MTTNSKTKQAINEQKKTKPRFTPILLGSDFNAYGMARAFYDLYGKPVTAYAEKELAPTRFSKIIDVHLIPGFSKEKTWIKTMRKLKEKYKNYKEPVILIGCGDGYAELISKYKNELEDVFVCPYVDYSKIKQLNSKEEFYKLCDKYNLPYPKTTIISKKMYEHHRLPKVTNFPVALKPTNSVEWLEINFSGRKKAFIIKNESDLKHIIGQIYQHGYNSDLILQDFIPGDDSNMRVVNAYVDKHHKVRMMSLGHPLLEDPAPGAIGNYVAIMPEYNKEIYDQLKQFLEKIKFTGYANFDLKYDPRDHKYKLFEINLRQGRSSFFVTLNGNNLAQWVVKDYVEDNLKNETPVYANQAKDKRYLWLGVSPRVFRKYATNNELKQQAIDLINQKKFGNTFLYKKDNNLQRWLLFNWMNHIYSQDFKLHFENK